VIVNQRTIDLLKQFEGCKLTAYQDVAGVWTIGYGTTASAGVGIEPHEGMTITQEQAEVLLHKTIDNFAPAVASRITVPVSSNEFGACLCLSYNIGLGAFAKSTVLREINAGNKGKAAEAFKMWNKAGGKVVKGLVNRRAAESALFLEADMIVADMHTAVEREEKPESFISMIIRVIMALIGGK
jgi:lysozyme